jgi:hypothetical protein
MASASEQRMADLVARLRESPGIAGSLPSEERAMVDAALDGVSVHVIAQDHGISVEAVWSVLGNAAQLASGHGPTSRVEQGGLGSDTDPGVTGGYGDTGFGALDTEPPIPDSEEPREGDLSALQAEPRRDD